MAKSSDMHSITETHANWMNRVNKHQGQKEICWGKLFSFFFLFYKDSQQAK